MAHRMSRKQRIPAGKTQETGVAQRRRVPAPAVANHRILRALQPKLEIGDASDAFEEEADQVAERVMQVSTAGVISASPGPVQRKCSCGGSEKCDKCREDDLLQRSAASSAKPAQGPPSVAQALREPGRRLDPAARAFMEPRFGHDFGHVRIHTGSQAASSARALHALAYTVGHDVVFGAGQYAPQSSEGQRLLAHELTHVVQQGASGVIHRQPDQDPTENAPAPQAAAPAEEQAPEQKDAGDEADVEPEGQGEAIENTYDSKCVAPHSEDTAQAEEPKVAAKADAASSRTLGSRIVPPDHSSEREAESVSQAVVVSPPFRAVGNISRTSRGLVQRTLAWDSHPTLTWADFQGSPDNKSQFDAATRSGFSASWRPQEEASPDSPVNPTPCTARGKKTTRFSATVSLDISPANLHATTTMEEKRSWVKAGKQSDDLLSHEQGHYDISHVMAGKTDWALTMWGIKNLGKGEGCGDRAAKNAARKNWNALNPKDTLNGIIKKGGDVLQKAQDDYDADTHHGAVADKQKEWKGNIVADLPGYDVK